jgi:hypothetical protein
MTAKEVADWMLAKITKDKEVYQEDVVYEIEKKFGREFVYENESGNIAIGKNVLKEFRKLTEDIVVWERGARFWRMRVKSDPLGKRQAD